MGMLILDGETLTLDGGTRPPYNLSTGYGATNLCCKEASNYNKSLQNETNKFYRFCKSLLRNDKSAYFAKLKPAGEPTQIDLHLRGTNF